MPPTKKRKITKILEPVSITSDLSATATKDSSETQKLPDQSQNAVPSASDPPENPSITAAEKDQDRKERFRALQARAVSV